MAMTGRFKVQHHFSYGWDDAGWTETDPVSDKAQPLRFATPEEAQVAIDELVAGTVEAVLAGNMPEGYSRGDFRVMPE